MYLDLTATNLSGTLPTEIGLAMDLSHLELGTDYLTGVIPTNLATLGQLGTIRRCCLYASSTSILSSRTSC